jgi:hypothetical protein
MAGLNNAVRMKKGLPRASSGRRLEMLLGFVCFRASLE